LFQTFFPSIFFFSSRRKEKKTIEKKKNTKKGGNLPSSFCFAFSLLTPTSALLFLPFRFKCILLGIFFFQTKGKKKSQRKKTIERKEMQRKEGAYISSLASAFGMKCSSWFFLSTFLQH